MTGFTENADLEDVILLIFPIFEKVAKPELK